MKRNVQIGLKENWKQFIIWLFVITFVGGIIGIERIIFPQFAELKFSIASKTAILLFITAFGIIKAIAKSTAGMELFYFNAFYTMKTID